MNPLDFVKGYKTYILGVVAVLTGIVMLSEGQYGEGWGVGRRGTRLDYGSEGGG